MYSSELEKPRHGPVEKMENDCFESLSRLRFSSMDHGLLYIHGGERKAEAAKVMLDK